MLRLFSILIMLFSSVASAKTLTLDTTKRYAEVIDVVDGGAITTASQIEKWSRENKEPITLLINSPGGFIAPGFILVDAVKMAKERGVKVKCLSGVLAASMAFIILAHCSERYALPNTMLLFHPVSFGGERIRITEALPSLQETNRQEQFVDKHLMDVMDMSYKDYHGHSYSETLWTGAGLARFTKGSRFITIVDDVQGVDKLFIYRQQRFNLFGSRTMKLIPKKLRGLYE